MLKTENWILMAGGLHVVLLHYVHWGKPLMVVVLKLVQLKVVGIHLLPFVVSLVGKLTNVL